MLEIFEGPDHLVGFKLSGDLTGNDVDGATKALTDALQRRERISIFTEMDGSVTLTLEGLWKDLINSVSNFGLHKKIYRLAVVTGSEVYSFLLRIEGIFFSSIEMRVFSPGQRSEALAWASKEPGPLSRPEPARRAIRFLQTTNTDVFAYEVDGRITEKDIEAAATELKSFFERTEKVNILLRIKEFSGFDLSAILNDVLYAVKFNALSKVERYAVIGAPAWMRNFLELIDPAFKVEFRVFDAENENDAWEWVGASQSLLAETS